MNPTKEIPQITLKAARVNAGLTLSAAAIELGISVSTLIKWERDPGEVTPNKQKYIEAAYQYPTDYIFFGN